MRRPSRRRLADTAIRWQAIQCRSRPGSQPGSPRLDRAQHHQCGAACRRAPLPVVGARAGGRRDRPRGADGRRFHRLPRRVSRATPRPVLQAGARSSTRWPTGSTSWPWSSASACATSSRGGSPSPCRCATCCCGVSCRSCAPAATPRCRCTSSARPPRSTCSTPSRCCCSARATASSPRSRRSSAGPSRGGGSASTGGRASSTPGRCAPCCATPHAYVTGDRPWLTRRAPRRHRTSPTPAAGSPSTSRPRC